MSDPFAGCCDHGARVASAQWAMADESADAAGEYVLGVRADAAASGQRPCRRCEACWTNGDAPSVHS